MNDMNNEFMKFRKKVSFIVLMIITFFSLSSCSKDFLSERPLSQVDTDLLFSTKQGFESYIVSLHEGARQEHDRTNSTQWVLNMWSGTDVATTGSTIEINWKNYNTWLTPARPLVDNYWQWAYRIMLVRANTVIAYAEKPELQNIWDSEAEKNAIIAEAKFFRAYTHNLLANLYGGVPIIEQYYTAPKTDFIRASRQEVYESARRDLEFASKWLPPTVKQEGRIVKAAADHLLAEVYISLEKYDKAIESASAVIDSKLYHLMTDRFGSEANLPGDVFSDLFKQGNQNRSSGNMESIYVWQFEDVTPGGLGAAGGNYLWRIWGPFYIQLLDPAGRSGMVLADSLSRGVAFSRPTTWFLYDIWGNDFYNDMRNSPYNIKRTYYYNNPSSSYFGQKVEKKTTLIDTMQRIYPLIRKVEGKRRAAANQPDGFTSNDIMVYRLAETYLLRAEAYLRSGEQKLAADDINKVRERANATPINFSDVTLDYILDERARELIVEEPRRRTLTRVGKLVERTKKYTDYASTKNSIQNYHEFFPIPLREIDANFGAKLEQNIGYQ